MRTVMDYENGRICRRDSPCIYCQYPQEIAGDSMVGHWCADCGMEDGKLEYNHLRQHLECVSCNKVFPNKR